MIDLAAITELDDIIQLTEKFHDAEFCIGAGKLSAFMRELQALRAAKAPCWATHFAIVDEHARHDYYQCEQKVLLRSERIT